VQLPVSVHPASATNTLSYSSLLHY
jgi:hypothetical protein